MLRLCLFCVLVVLPLFVVSDPIRSKNSEDLHDLEEQTTSIADKTKSGCFYRCKADHEKVQLFQDFYVQHNKKYGAEEYIKRFKIFQKNLEEIDRLNREEQGTAVYGITPFADLTYEEFTRNSTGGRLSEGAWARHEERMEAIGDEEIEFVDNLDELRDSYDFEGASEEEDDSEEEDMVVANDKVFIPKQFDYRKKKAVTPVKNQGACGSCWAFSAISNIEGVWAKKKKQLIDLSEQELLDCDKVDLGCMGGWMEDAVKELVRLGGVAKSKDYPYTAQEGQCRFKKSMAAVKVSGTRGVPANEKKIARALIKNGPLSVAVVASANFQFYVKGIFNPDRNQCSTNKQDVNHGVTIVGYGVEKSLPYWVIKNSWGDSWGDKGYIKLIRGKNACAVSSYVSTAYL